MTSKSNTTDISGKTVLLLETSRLVLTTDFVKRKRKIFIGMIRHLRKFSDDPLPI